MSDKLGDDAGDRNAELASSDLYSAEFIVDKKRGTYRGKKTNLYRVRWTGYTAADDTWEPIENLNDALLSDFEESLKRRRPKQPSNAVLLEEDIPLVTWSDLLHILGLCPPEYLPKCLQPTPIPKVKRNFAGEGQEQPSIQAFFSSSGFSQHSGPNSSLNQRIATADINDFFPCKSRQAASPGRVSAAQHANESVRYARRPRLKQAMPSRSPIANVLMNY